MGRGLVHRQGALAPRSPSCRGQGIDDLRQAVAALQTTKARLVLGQALASLGSALTEQAGGQPSAEALNAWKQAFALAEQCGATGLRAEVGQLLAATGIEVPAQPSGTRQLTTTEHRIAWMDRSPPRSR